MRVLTYTLLADGPSDRCLQRIINWMLTRGLPRPSEFHIDSRFADYRDHPRPPRGLVDRIQWAVRDFPCQILFIHRDAERQGLESRHEEISRAAEEAGVDNFVCVVPVRMTEAWLLFDEPAIRRAAGNPNGNMSLGLPKLQRVESEPDPKELLRAALETASGANGRKLKLFRQQLSALVPRVADYIEDFSPLRKLSAFQEFEKQVGKVLAEL